MRFNQELEFPPLLTRAAFARIGLTLLWTGFVVDQLGLREKLTYPPDILNSSTTAFSWTGKFRDSELRLYCARDVEDAVGWERWPSR